LRVERSVTEVPGRNSHIEGVGNYSRDGKIFTVV
jgi:chemotaxis signal transduction protein